MKKIEQVLRKIPAWVKLVISFVGWLSPLLLAIYFSAAAEIGIEYSLETYRYSLYAVSAIVGVIMIGCRIEVIRVSREAGRDFLTGLLNRRSFQNNAEGFLGVQTTRESEQPIFSIALVDLDNFKELNDTIGHGAGDEALKIVAQMLHSVSRGSDSVARLGGDEFAIIYPRMKGAEAKRRLEALREKISSDQRLSFKDKSFRERRITISVGIMTVDGAMVEKFKEGHAGGDIVSERILPRVDALLYEAKRGGRNRVVTDNDNG